MKMKWQQVRNQYPHKWVIIHPIKSFTDKQGHQIIEEFEVERLFDTQSEAIQYLEETWRKEPNTNPLVVDTKRKELRFIPHKPMKGELPE